MSAHKDNLGVWTLHLGGKRPHGVRLQDWLAMMQFEESKATIQGKQWPIVEVTVACRCSKYDFPHIHQTYRRWTEMPSSSQVLYTAKPPPERECWIHGAAATWWARPDDGSDVCQQCHPNPHTMCGNH